METTPHRILAREGFSLIEVLIAITIIALMATAVSIGVFGALEDSRVERARQDVSNLANAVKLFKAKEGTLPKQSDWPDFLTNGSKKYPRPYIENKDGATDPWGNTYVYKVSGSKFNVMSFGADGVPGGEGEDADIKFDEEER